MSGTELQMVDATGALLLIIVKANGVADIRPGKGMTPEYVAQYLDLLAKKFRDEEGLAS